MRLTVIGCTGSMSGPESAASSYLVQAWGEDPVTGVEREWNVVLDLGPGAFGALWRHVDPCALDAVSFSHCHADHMGDVISLHVHRRWGPARGFEPLLLCGPAGLEHRIKQIDGCDASDSYAGEFRFHTWAEGGAPVRVGPLTLTPFVGWHTVPSFGVRVEGPSEVDPAQRVSLFYTGDTDECASIEEGARGVDLLLSEAGFTGADTVRGIHLDGVRAGALAARAGVGRLVVTHVQPWTDRGVVAEEVARSWSGPVDFAVSDAQYVL